MSNQPKPTAVFTEPERCPRCKGTGFIGKAVDVEGNLIPKPTDEWTEIAQEAAKTIQRNYDRATYKLDWITGVIQDAITAALAAGREKVKVANTQCKTIAALMQDAEQQLAAERKASSIIAENARNLHIENVRLAKQLAAAQAALVLIRDKTDNRASSRAIAHIALKDGPTALKVKSMDDVVIYYDHREGGEKTT